LVDVLLRINRVFHHMVGIFSEISYMIGPQLPLPAVFAKEKYFQEFLLTKSIEFVLTFFLLLVINAEKSAMHSPEFRDKLERTRKTLLTELANQFVENKKKSPKRKILG
jgi:hypothetical protein